MDDTLLRSDLTISDRTIETIKKAREQGVYFTFATGRMPRAVRPYAEKLGINVPVITYSGALVQEALTGEVLYHKVVPTDTASDIISWFLDQGIHAHVYLKDQIYVHEMNDYTREYIKVIKAPIEVSNLLELLSKEEEGVEKIIFFESEDKLRDIGKVLLDRYKGKIHLTKSKPRFLEIINPNVNKGVALKALAERIGVKREEIMAFGDNINDLEMIEYAGLGVAIGNACQELKDLADVITSSNQDDGVAKAIETYVLQK